MKNKLDFLSLSKYCFYLFIFFIPFQIDLSIYAPELYISGKFNIYQNFFINISEILLLISVLFLGISVLRKELELKISYGNKLVFIFLILLFISFEISLYFSVDQIHTLLWIVRYFTFGFLYIYITSGVVKISRIIDIFIASISVQALIAILQYILQGSIGLGFLGEPAISSITPGIAKIDLLGLKVIRPYGTLPHPNILAGFLLVSIFFSFHRVRKGNYIAYPLIIIQLIAFVLTFSRSAFLGLFIAFLFYISLHETKISLKYILLTISAFILIIVIFDLEFIIYQKLLFVDIESINERLEFLRIGKYMLFENPFGVGLGNFTYLMQDFTVLKLAPWTFQPVHNIYLLMFNENGIIGGVIFILLLISIYLVLFLKIFNMKLKKEIKEFYVVIISVFSGLLVIGLFDHYLISIYQGLILFFLVFIFASVKKLYYD